MDPRVKAFAQKSLRRASYRWPARSEAMKKARISYGTYRCNICAGEFRRKNTNLDHKDPVVKLTGWDGFDSFIERLLCGEDGYQVLCTLCHAMKTSNEASERAHERHKKAEVNEAYNKKALKQVEEMFEPKKKKRKKAE